MLRVLRTEEIEVESAFSKQKQAGGDNAVLRAPENAQGEWCIEPAEFMSLTVSIRNRSGKGCPLLFRAIGLVLSSLQKLTVCSSGSPSISTTAQGQRFSASPASIPLFLPSQRISYRGFPSPGRHSTRARPLVSLRPDRRDADRVSAVPRPGRRR